MADEELPIPDSDMPLPEGGPSAPTAVAPQQSAGQNVISVNIEDEMRQSYLDYAMSTIIARALPDVRDGLKPVQRRILMAMSDLNLTPGAQHRKSAKIAGDTSGNYHPHGEAVVYPTMVRMAQPFSLRYPLVDGQGNFGCFTGDTKIKLLDGTEKSFAELAALPKGEVFHVYSVDAAGRIVVGKGRYSRITRRDAALLEVTLDSGERLRCTPDHRFLLRDGTYKQAQHLTVEDSLMPGYFDTAPVKAGMNEYLRVQQPSTGQYEFVHCLADDYNKQQGLARPMQGAFVRHHSNFSRWDNRPSNIERMGFLEHLHLHAAHTKELWQDAAFRETQRQGVQRYYDQTPQAREQRRERMTRQNKDEAFRAANGQRASAGLKRRFAADATLAAAISERMAALWQDPDYREKMSFALSGVEKRTLSPKEKERVAQVISEKSRAMWGDEAKRTEIVQAISQAMASPEVRARVSAGVRQVWQNPAHRAKYGDNHFSQMAQTLWADPAAREQHSEKIACQRQDTAFVEAQKAGVRRSNARRLLGNPHMMTELAAKASAALTEKWQDPTHRQQVMRQRIAKYGSLLIAQVGRDNVTPEAYEANRNANWMPKLATALRYYSSFDELVASAQTYNHKILSLRWLDETADVYDITVDEHHNFLLASGVFVHNSIDGDPPAAMRYCVTADTLVVTGNGLVPMGDISQDGGEDIQARVLSHGGVTHTASKWFDSGVHPTLHVQTRHGYQVTGTDNHPLLTCRADDRGRPSFHWKTLGELAAGDVLVVDRSEKLWPEHPVALSPLHPTLPPKSRTQRHALPATLDSDLAFLLGALTAEGTVRDTCIDTNTHDGAYAEMFQAAWARVFPTCRLHVFERQATGYGKKPFLQMQVVSQHVIAFLRALGLNGKSGQRSIPPAVLRSSQAVAAAFLRGLYEGDGAVEQSGQSLLRVSLCSNSERLLTETQTLLLRFGITSSRFRDSKRGMGRLCLVGQDNLHRFAGKIGFASPAKREALFHVLVAQSGRALPQKDSIPLIAAYVRARAGRHREWLAKNNFDRPERFALALPCLREAMQDAADSQMLAFLAQANYLYDPVTEISEAGRQRVYSVRVDSDCHSFVANGFVNHNTEARMSPFATEMLQDLDRDTVDWTDNYDQTRQEPTVLPGKFPNFLCNGGSGIAVGMATNVPPHNLGEIVDGLMHLLDHPDATPEDMLTFVKGPDFPTAGLILGTKAIRQAYATGRGSVIMQARTTIETEGGRNTIVITELPYQVIKARLIEQIADLVKQKKLEGIADLNDYSDRTGMRVVVTLKKDAYPKKVLNYLLKHTPLRTTFGVNMLALVTGQPRILDLPQALNFFLDHRREVVTRRTLFELNKAKERAHILEGLLIALDFLDEIIALIRASRTAEAARGQMIERFALSVRQADAILAMQLRALTGLEREKTENDYKELLKQIAFYEDILSNPARVAQIIKQELRALKDKYGDERRTRIVPMEAEEIGDEDLIPEEEMIVTITRDGYIKRVPRETFPDQKRGGKGRIGARPKEDDQLEHMFVATTHHFILFFTDRGRVYRLKAYEVPQTSRTAVGTAIINLINVQPGERITATVPMKDYKDAEGFLLFATECGEVKRTKLAEFANLRNNGLIVFDIEENDALRWVAHTTGKNEVVLVTRKGMSIRFGEDAVPPRGRAAGGVRGIRLSEERDDRIVGMSIVQDDKELLVISAKGISKRTPFSEYRVTNRGGVGIKTMNLGDKTGDVVDALAVDKDDRLLIMTDKGITIRLRVDDIRSSGRSTQGVRAINLAEDDMVSSVERMLAEKEPVDA